MSEEKKYATRDAFLSGYKRRFKEVDVPLLGAVKIGSMSEKERQAFEAWLRDRKGEIKPDRMKAIRLKYIVECTYDQNEQRMFSDADIPALMEKDVDLAVTRFLMDAISKHVGFDDADIEELAKN